MKKLLLLISLSFVGSIGSSITAQSFYNHRLGRDLIASFGTGTSTYFGDLKAPKEGYFDAMPNLNIGIQYFFTPAISGRAEVNWFRLEGDDGDAQYTEGFERNLSFRSDNFEATFVGIYNLMPMGRKFYQRPQINAYGFAGIGFLYFNPKGLVPATDWNENPLQEAGQYVPLQPLQTEGEEYSRFGVVIPAGLGVKFKINPFFNLAVEGGYRVTFTDYLDDVSNVYKEHTSFQDPLAQIMADRRHELGLEPKAAGQIRGNNAKNDGYYMVNFKVEYYLPNNFLSSNKYKRYKRRPSRPRRR